MLPLCGGVLTLYLVMCEGHFEWTCEISGLMINVKIRQDHELCLVGSFLNIEEPLNKYQTVATTWKSESPLPLSRWYAEMNRCVPMEKIPHKF